MSRARKPGAARSIIKAPAPPIVDVLADFDLPDNAFAAPKRANTTTPLQTLTLLNSQFTLDMANALAARLANEAGGDPAAQVTRAFAVAFQREPLPAERDAALKTHPVPRPPRLLPRNAQRQ
jgi:hypothetical protein